MITAAMVEGPSRMLERYYDIPVNRAVLARVVKGSGLLQEELRLGSWSDTCARESFLEAYSLEVTGQYWPTYGDGWSEADFTAFVEKFDLA